MEAQKVKVVEPSERVTQERQRAADERAGVGNATSVRYLSKADALALTMRSGAKVIVPRAFIGELHDAPKAKLTGVALMPGGDAIAVDALDVHISIAGLLRDVFGLNAGQRAGGRARTPAKLAAVRANGAKGGRPRKTALA